MEQEFPADENISDELRPVGTKVFGNLPLFGTIENYQHFKQQPEVDLPDNHPADMDVGYTFGAHLEVNVNFHNHIVVSVGYHGPGA